MSAPGFPFFKGLNLASISLPKNRIFHCGYGHPGVPLLLGGLLKPFEVFWWLLGSLGGGGLVRTFGVSGGFIHLKVREPINEFFANESFNR